MIFLSTPLVLCTKEVAFFQLEALTPVKGTTYEIRGFLYKTDAQQYILAAEPNLKSCCVGSASKRNKQLLVFGEIDPNLVVEDRPVTLKGELEGDPQKGWHMKKAVILAK